MRLWFARRVAVRYSRSEGRETKTKEDCAEGDSLKSRVVPGGENLDGDIMGVLDEVLLVGSLVVGESLLECFDVLELLLGDDFSVVVHRLLLEGVLGYGLIACILRQLVDRRHPGRGEGGQGLGVTWAFLAFYLIWTVSERAAWGFSEPSMGESE